VLFWLTKNVPADLRLTWRAPLPSRSSLEPTQPPT